MNSVGLGNIVALVGLAWAWLIMSESGLLPQKFEPKWPPIFPPYFCVLYHHSLQAYFGIWNKIPEADFGLQNQILEAGLHFNGPGATAHNQDSWTIKQDNSGTA